MTTKTKSKVRGVRKQAHGFIQWKGTDVCADLTCLCGEHLHFDGDFMYHVKCPYCGQVYKCDAEIKLFPIGSEPEFTIHLEKNDLRPLTPKKK